jgi:hypothetical protein
MRVVVMLLVAGTACSAAAAGSSQMAETWRRQSRLVISRGPCGDGFRRAGERELECELFHVEHFWSLIKVRSSFERELAATVDSTTGVDAISAADDQRLISLGLFKQPPRRTPLRRPALSWRPNFSDRLVDSVDELNSSRE